MGLKNFEGGSLFRTFSEQRVFKKQIFLEYYKQISSYNFLNSGTTVMLYTSIRFDRFLANKYNYIFFLNMTYTFQGFIILIIIHFYTKDVYNENETETLT